VFLLRRGTRAGEGRRPVVSRRHQGLSGLCRQYSDDFAFVHVNDQSVFDLDRIEGLDAATNHAGCYIITDEVDDWHARFAAVGLPITPIEDMPWGMHEFRLTDPSGNNIRVGRNISNE
jgi:hypothetical protein